MRIAISNRDHRPSEIQIAELREMGIASDLSLVSFLWRESTSEEDYLWRLEDSLRGVGL